MKFRSAYPFVSILQHPMTTDVQRQDIVAPAKPASGSEDVGSEKETSLPMSKNYTDNV